jgi:outer membrane protein assembly factor BamB
MFALLVLAPLSAAHASPTRSFVIDSASALGEGKLEGTSVSSDGSIIAGAQTRRTELPGVPAAKSLLVLSDGRAYIGTGNDGKIYRYRAGTVSVFAETKQVMVSSLALDDKGTLYAGTLPSGKVFAIAPDGKLRELVALPGAEHVWALRYDAAHRTLFAATGPEGKLFAIDDKGKASVYYDSEDAHIMALERAPDGSWLVGTSDRALLLRLRGPGRAEVIYDFDGSEITALAVRGAQIAVISNLFPKTVTPAKPATLATPPANDANKGTNPAPPAPAPAPAQAGKGQLYRVNASGQVERLFTADEGSLTTVEWADDAVIYVGTGKEGHIHRVRASDHTHALIVDVDERQILAQQLTGPAPRFITADGAAVYELDFKASSGQKWTSKVLDAGGRARFGRLVARGRGSFELRTRSGNTDKADDGWSAWSQPLAADSGIASPAARFLQLQVRLLSLDSVVYALEAFYLADNQPALITEITVEPPRPASGKSPSSTYKLRWKVENPDNDSLRYRVAAVHEGASRYLPLTRDSDVLTNTEYNWDTVAVPDGYYRVRVSASDELDNAAPQALETRDESEPFLVDNRPPEIASLHVENARVLGVARDASGPLTKLEYNVDGLEWRLVRADDDLLDRAEEHFSIALAALPKGPHLLAVRATDARGNTATRDLELTVP